MFRACTLAVLLAAGPLLAQDQADLARYLPPDTPFYLEAKSPTPAEMGQMAYYRCLEDPRLKTLMERLFGTESSFTTSKFDLGPARVAVNMDMSKPDFAINVTYQDGKGKRSMRLSQRFVVSWLGLAPGELPIDLVAAMQVDSDPAAAVETLKRIIAAGKIAVSHRKRRPPVDAVLRRDFENFEHEGVTCCEARIERVKLYMAPIGKLLVVTTTKPRLLDIINRSRAKAVRSLATDARYRAMHERAGGTGTATTIIYFQLDRTLDAIAKQEAQGAAVARLFLSQVGLEGFKSFTTVSRSDGTGVTSTSEMLIDGPRRGLAQLFSAGEPPTLSCLEFAPKNSLYANAGNFDVKGLYNIALQLGGMMVTMGQAELEKMTGLKLREDILDTLGREAGIIVSTNRGLIPDVALVFKVKDPARLEKSLLHLLNLPKWQPGTGPVSYTIAGNRAYTVPLGHLEVPLSPTFGMVDGHLVISAFPMSFQRFVAVKKGERPSLAQNRDFAKLRQRVPDDALGLSYLDLARVFELIYDTAIPLLQSLPPQPGVSAHYELPDVAVFSQHLYGRVGWRTADDKGMYWYSHSSIDTGGAMLGLIGAGVGALALVQEAREPTPPPVQVMKGRRDREARTCSGRVRFLRARMILYMREHKKLPATLDELKAAHVTEDSFEVPGHEKKRYVYFGPDGRGDILLHGFPNGRDLKVCVITTKLKPERITARELEQRLGSKPVRGPR